MFTTESRYPYTLTTRVTIYTVVVLSPIPVEVRLVLTIQLTKGIVPDTRYTSPNTEDRENLRLFPPK